MLYVRLALMLAGLFLGSANARAENVPAPQPVPSQTPSPTPPQVKDFVIAPDDGGKTFMCVAGHLSSIVATAVGEHRIVSIVLVDASGSPIPQETWASASGFHLERKQTVKIRAIMICA